jgi:hypothetical protein
MFSLMKLPVRPEISFATCLFIALSCIVRMEGVIAQPSNNIRYYLVQEAGRISDNVLSGMNSLADWEDIKTRRYHEFMESMGLENMPEQGDRPDLNVTITGTEQRDGYRIEKLYYESLPGLYVPANLYVPDNIREPAPAVLYVCGHSADQKVVYQAYPAKFAELGFVCLIIETIQLGEVRGVHHGCYSRGWFNWYSRGYTPAGVELWNAIRGIDLLCERQEVDPEKIGVTGRSGGGAQSWFIAAADPRIKAAAPVAGATTLEAHIETRSIDRHCDCMVPINTFRRDFQDVGALIAPRPLMIIQGDGDNLNPIEGVRELYHDLSAFYGLYGASDNIYFVEYPGGHAAIPGSRKKLFAFFVEQLLGEETSADETGDYDDSPEALLSAEALKVYLEGPPGDDRTTTIQDSFIKLAEPPVIHDEKELNDFSASVKDFLAEKTFGAFPEKPVPLEPRLVFQSADLAQYGHHEYSFVPEEGWRLKLDIRWRNEPGLKRPLMIVLRNPDEDRREAENFIRGFDNSWNIAYLEVRGVGECGWDPCLQWHVRRASAWTGRTIASMQVYDLLRCLEFCRTLENINTDSIGIAAKDEMCVVALYAAMLDGHCAAVLLQNPPESQDVPSNPEGKGPAIEMLNCLKVTDVYQLPTLIPDTEIIFKGKIPEAYRWSEQIRKKIGKRGYKSFNH